MLTCRVTKRLGKQRRSSTKSSSRYSRSVLAAAHAADALELLHAVGQRQQVQHLAKAAPPEVTCADRPSQQHSRVMMGSSACGQYWDIRAVLVGIMHTARCMIGASLDAIFDEKGAGCHQL
jgi:hypothetical protein